MQHFSKAKIFFSLVGISVVVLLLLTLIPSHAPTNRVSTHAILKTTTLVIHGIPISLVLIPKGCFKMGSPMGERGRRLDEKQQTICLESYWMADRETTNADYRHFRPRHDSGSYKNFTLNNDAQPVVRIHWNDATAYAEWLSQQTVKTFRLPTEAEWEMAARAGVQSPRYWGDNLASTCHSANTYDRYARSQFPSFNWAAHPCNDRYATTAPVGSFQPNPWGLKDMLGNVWEWTCSGYETNPPENESDDLGSRTRCASKGRVMGRRIIRGGSWVNQPTRVRAAFRQQASMTETFHSVGLRLVMEK